MFTGKGFLQRSVCSLAWGTVLTTHVRDNLIPLS